MASRQMILRAEFESDHGECAYCGGYRYAMPHNWLVHLRDQHPDTIRRMGVELALAQADPE